MKRSITKSVIAIVMLLSAVSFGSPNLSGQYWFGSLSVDVNTNAPWAKRGTVSITGNQWLQHWEDYDGNHMFSETFTTTFQQDGSININFPAETYNIAWNGDVMIHAGSVLGGGGEGIDIFTRKATNVDVNDVLGDHSFLGHQVNSMTIYPLPSDSCEWGNFTFDPNGTSTLTYTNADGRIEPGGIINWTLDDVNAIINIVGPMINDIGHAALFLGKGGIGSAWQIVPEEGRSGDLGYNIFIKKTDQAITMADIVGTYQVRFLETGPGAVPYTCGQGTCVIEAVDDANGILLVDANYSDGEHSVKSKDCSVGPGNEFHLDDDGVPDGIISPDKNLIFGVEYRYKNPPTRRDYDWLGGTFLVRMPATNNNIADLNGDGIVDSADMYIMIEYWGTDNQLCDIAPIPWGDGIVDALDLTVLTEHLLEVYPPAETVEINEGNDGEQVELELGEILVVTLESNPSTGYRWEQPKNSKSILVQLGQAEFKSSETGEPPMVGAGGWEIFRFKAVSAGQMTLELVYHRSWEEGVEPLKTFSIQVVVP